MPKLPKKGWILDEIDKFILEKLMNNAKTKLKELCNITGITKVPMSYRVNSLAKDFILGTYSRVNKKALGYTVDGVLLVSLKSQTNEMFDEFTCYVANRLEIRSLELVSGSCDYIIKFVAKDNNHASDILEFIRDFPSINRVQFFNILSTPIYREGVPL